MAEMNEKQEVLRQKLENQLKSKNFMDADKFPIIGISKMDSQCKSVAQEANLNLKEHIKKLLDSSLREESVQGITSLIQNDVKALMDIEDGQEKVLQGYAVAVDRFSLVRIDYMIWCKKYQRNLLDGDVQYTFAGAGSRSILDIRKTEWKDFVYAYAKILKSGLAEELSNIEKQKRIKKSMDDAYTLFRIFKGEIML